MAPRRLLLVGEGNFSFAAALSETLDASTRVTATCLQRSADVAGNPVARENLRRLLERGSEAIPSAQQPPRPAPLLARPELEREGKCRLPWSVRFPENRLWAWTGVVLHGPSQGGIQVLRHPSVCISCQVPRCVLVWTAPSWQTPSNRSIESLIEFILIFRTVDEKLE